ncbi:MAG: DUF99 family protein [Candidatus Bathyarchaeia archaeon]
MKVKNPTRGPIREVKPEIRVMGLWSVIVRRGYTDFIGVVYRGGLWLDGVLRRRIKNGDREAITKLAKAIRASPHFGQLRVIITQDSPEMRMTILKAERLNELTSLPVIVLSEDAKLFRAYGLDDSTAYKILQRIQGSEGIPDALRVAKLFSKALANRSKG